MGLTHFKPMWHLMGFDELSEEQIANIKPSETLQDVKFLEAPPISPNWRLIAALMSIYQKAFAEFVNSLYEKE